MIHIRHVSILLVLSGVSLTSAKLAAQDRGYPAPGGYHPGMMPGGGGTTAGTTGGMPGSGSSSGQPNTPNTSYPGAPPGLKKCEVRGFSGVDGGMRTVSGGHSLSGNVKVEWSYPGASGNIAVKTMVAGSCNATYNIVAENVACSTQRTNLGEELCYDCDRNVTATLTDFRCSANFGLAGKIDGRYGFKYAGGTASGGASGNYSLKMDCELAGMTVVYPYAKGTAVWAGDNILHGGMAVDYAAVEMAKIVGAKTNACLRSFVSGAIGPISVACEEPQSRNPLWKPTKMCSPPK